MREGDASRDTAIAVDRPQEHWREAIGKLIILAASAWAVFVLSVFVALRVLGELTVRLPAVRWEGPDILAAVLVLYVGTAIAAWGVARRLGRGI